MLAALGCLYFLFLYRNCYVNLISFACIICLIVVVCYLGLFGF